MAPRISEDDLLLVRRTTTDRFSILRGGSLAQRDPSTRNPDRYDSSAAPRSSRYGRDSLRTDADDLNSSGFETTDRFHYLTKYKDLVCRCADTSHYHFRSVYNFEIRALCTEYFQRNPENMLCDKTEWREVFRSLFVAKCPESSVSCRRPAEQTYIHNEPTYNHAEPTYNHTESTYAYTEEPAHIYSKPTYTHLNPTEQHRPEPNQTPLSRYLETLDISSPPPPPRPTLPSPPASSRKNRASLHPIRNGANGDLDMPAQVWRDARPSAYASRHGLDSTASTPLGEPAHVYPRESTWAPPPLNLTRRVAEAQRAASDVSELPGASSSTSRYEGRGGARGGDFAPSSVVYRGRPSGNTSGAASAASSSAASSAGLAWDFANELEGVPVSELHGGEVAAEMSSASRRGPACHLRTLRLLEGAPRR
jgi:hypothetical protein